MNVRIGLQREAGGHGPTGQPIKGWQEFARPWAEAKSISGRQFTAASGEQSEVTMTFKVRYRLDVRAGMRVTHHGQTFEVVAPLEAGGRRFLMLMCKSVKV